MMGIIKVSQCKHNNGPSPIVVNGDVGKSFGGTGDLILLSYISFGCPDELQIQTRDGKRDCLKYFDIELATDRVGISAAAIFDQEVRDKGAIPRLQRACDFFKIKGQPNRPTVTLPEFAKEAAAKFWDDLTPRLLFCPETNDRSRLWSRWQRLGDMLGRDRKRDLTRDVARRHAPAESETWAVAMAIIASCDVFVGLDSAYAHLAGVFERQSIVILGPTQPSVFAHCPNTVCLTPPEGGRGCSGCSYSAPFDRKCRQSCVEIGRITADAVLAAIETKLQQR